MKKMMTVVLGAQLFCLSALADDMDAFRKTWDPLQASIEKAFVVANGLKPASYGIVGTRLTMQECEDVRIRILANYKVNPFNQRVEEGGVRWSLCESHYFRFATGSFVNQLGVSGAFFLQNDDFKSPHPQPYTIMLDSNYKIIEVAFVSFYGHVPGVPNEFETVTMDALGNAYRKHAFSKMDDPHLGLIGPKTWLEFLPKDGSMQKSTRAIHQSASHASQSHVLSILSRSDKQDWDFFEAPLSELLTTFYTYGGKLHFYPRFMSQLITIQVNGAERCSIGWIMANGAYQRLQAGDQAVCNQ